MTAVHIKPHRTFTHFKRAAVAFAAKIVKFGVFPEVCAKGRTFFRIGTNFFICFIKQNKADTRERVEILHKLGKLVTFKNK